MAVLFHPRFGRVSTHSPNQVRGELDQTRPDPEGEPVATHSPNQVRGERATPTGLRRRATRFNPLPQPSQGRTAMGPRPRLAGPVSTHSPNQVRGEPRTTFRKGTRPLFQPTPPTKSGENNRDASAQAVSGKFQPTPPTKSGENSGRWTPRARSTSFQPTPPTKSGENKVPREVPATRSTFQPTPPTKSGENRSGTRVRVMR